MMLTFFGCPRIIVRTFADQNWERSLIVMTHMSYRTISAFMSLTGSSQIAVLKPLVMSVGSKRTSAFGIQTPLSASMMVSVVNSKSRINNGTSITSSALTKKNFVRRSKEKVACHIKLEIWEMHPKRNSFPRITIASLLLSLRMT